MIARVNGERPILNYAPATKRSFITPRRVDILLAALEAFMGILAVGMVVLQIWKMPWVGGPFPPTLIAAIISAVVGVLRSDRSQRPGKPRSVVWGLAFWAVLLILPPVVYQLRGCPPPPPLNPHPFNDAM